MPDNATTYCNDEDVAIRAGADFAALVPVDISIAAGNDGAFDGADLWTLTSASVASFATQGVAAGMVAVLALPRQGMASPDPQLLVVDSVATSGITLRLKGQPAGIGQPPSPPGGQSGIEFTVATLATEIDRATTDINHRFSIDAGVPGRAPSDIKRTTGLRDLCVLTVLWKRYLAIAQRGNPDATNVADPAAARAASYWAKAKMIRQELDDLLGRTAIEWTGVYGVPGPSGSRFGMRIGR